jgi:hypothetical protein
MDNGVKIVFDLQQDEFGYPPYAVESLWALPVEAGGGYTIDNIPWYVREVACGDVVAAAPGDDGRLRFTGEVLQRSGNQTLRIRLAEESIVRSEAIREAILRLGAESELDHTQLLAVNAPAERKEEVQRFLETGAAQGHWELES